MPSNVTTVISEESLIALDKFCAIIHRSRAEVLRGLLHALLEDDKQFIYEEWREVVKLGHEPGRPPKG